MLHDLQETHFSIEWCQIANNQHDIASLDTHKWETQFLNTQINPFSSILNQANIKQPKKHCQERSSTSNSLIEPSPPLLTNQDEPDRDQIKLDRDQTNLDQAIPTTDEPRLTQIETKWLTTAASSLGGSRTWPPRRSARKWRSGRGRTWKVQAWWGFWKSSNSFMFFSPPLCGFRFWSLRVF